MKKRNGIHRNEVRISTGKTILVVVLAIVILVISQMLAMLLGNVPVMFGVSAAIGNVIAGILYPLITYMGIRFLCDKVWKVSVTDCKITRFSLKSLWCVAAIVMPCMVSGILINTTGHWENNTWHVSEILEIATSAIFFYGLGVGMVEEMIFRGVIMHVLEQRCNKAAAIFVPSVLFGLLHIIGNDLGFIDTLQLLAAGSIVGILFSVVTYESGNVWNSAIIHGVWNMIIVGGILHIGDAADELAIYNYVLDTNSFWITGGDFGIEASLVSVVTYLIFAVLAVVLIKKNKKNG